MCRTWKDHDDVKNNINYNAFSYSLMLYMLITGSNGIDKIL